MLNQSFSIRPLIDNRKIPINRLGNMLIHPCFFCSYSVLCECICCHCNDRYFLNILSVHRTDPLCGIITIHDWHHDIHQNHIKFTRSAFSNISTVSSPFHALVTSAPSFLKHKFCNFHVQLIIFRQKNVQPLYRFF